MKNIKFLIPVLLMAISSAFLTSCVKGEFDEPPINIPTVDFEATTTIQEFRESYSALKEITDDVVITGIVTANDESGNLYKKMIIQDETGALELAIDQTNLANEYKVGQRVYIKCKGLYVGDYNNLIQLGYIYNGGIGRMPAVMVPSHIFRDSLAGEKPVPQVLTISDLGETDKTNPVVSRLVTFENVMFATPGELFAPDDKDATDRMIFDQSGSDLVVRSSKYSNFSSNKIPQGYGKLTGILSLYRETWQLTLRDLTDVTGFSDTIPLPTATGNGTFEDPYNIESARINSSTTPVWVKGFIVGVYETVNPVFVPNFTGPYTTNSNLLLADSPDETILAKCVPVQLPGGAIRDSLNLVTNADNKGKEVMVLGTLDTYFSVPGVKNLSGYWLDGNGVLPATGFFTEEFNNSLGTFSQYSVLGDQVWAGGSFDGGCVVMSGFVDGSKFANEDWLISPSISLAGKTGVTMKFREAMNFGGNINEEAKVFVSTNYSGSGDPNDADWTEMTGFTRSAGNDWSFVDCGDIDLSAFEGQTIHVGFKYMSTTSVAGTWEISRMLLTSDTK